MAYHITLVTNNSSSSVAITNPAYEGDSKLILPNTKYVPKRPILINKMAGNPTYQQAAVVANNKYTSADNFCFWDNVNSGINGIGEKSPITISYYQGSAGNIQVTIDSSGQLHFASN